MDDIDENDNEEVLTDIEDIEGKKEDADADLPQKQQLDELDGHELDGDELELDDEDIDDDDNDDDDNDNPKKTKTSKKFDNDLDGDIYDSDLDENNPYDDFKDNDGPEGDDKDIDDTDDEDEDYLQKLKDKDHILENHRETLSVNYNTINELCKIIRNEDGVIDDPRHLTVPILSKYERTKIIGVRAKQLNNGAISFVNVPENIMDGLIIAEQELREKKIPFIVKRPIGNMKFEYWKLQDLEVL